MIQPAIFIGMSWLEFHHEAMATDFAIFIADQPAEYARQAAGATWRELERLENELSRFVETSDIARANRLAEGETMLVGPDTLQCLLLAAEVCVATERAFDAAYASEHAGDGPPFTLDPDNHTLTSHCPRLRLDLGAIGKGYALDRLAALLDEWGVTSALLESGGSTALALAPPSETTGWPVGIGEGASQRVLSLSSVALSGSGIAVKGAHLINPRARATAARQTRVWALASGAALSDALSTAFFVMRDEEIAAFCARHPDVGAAIATPGDGLLAHGTLAAYLESNPS